MFYILCIALCLAAMFLVLAGMSMLCLWSWRFLRLLVLSSAPSTAANLLFAIRVLPLLLAFLVTFGLALPAFVKFEPRSTSEMMSLRLLVLAAFGAFALLAMGIRVVKIVRATTAVQEQWRRRSKKLHVEGMNIPVYCLDGPRSAVAVLGILQPEIFVSREVAETLSPDELSAAIAHEKAHVSSLDNLKQLLLKVVRPPRWLNMLRMAETDWTSASEIAADEAALAAGVSALDLSGALVKVGRLKIQAVVGDAVAASHLLPIASGSAVEARMSHLQKLLEDEGCSRVEKRNGKRGMFFVLVLPVIAYAICVNGILPWVHEALELLVR
jgi:Zn-dependent protease with chaperone function